MKRFLSIDVLTIYSSLLGNQNQLFHPFFSKRPGFFYELLDTGLGKCRMCVAAPADYQDDPSRPVRVATKFVNIAKSYYASMGRDIDIIKLNGSIELAPILGLSDVIVDIVETGTTLRENGLKVVTEFMPISARFIANKASYQFKHNEMELMLTKLRAALAEQEAAK